MTEKQHQNLFDKINISTEHAAVLQQSLQERNNAYDNEFSEILDDAASIAAKLNGPCEKIYNQDIVQIGNPELLTETDQKSLTQILKKLRPWRKGPFSLMGIDIDSEWRSNLKWDRVAPYLPDLKNKTVCDVGCGNGYFMYRMLAYKPRFILGMDPTRKFKAMFDILQMFSKEANMAFELGGWEELRYMPASFDFIMAMGIVYHHSDPLDLLRCIRAALKPGGQALIETQGIPGDEPVALFPRKKYAGASGFYFLPTASCLQNWLGRAGFSKIELLHNIRLSTNEQRRTPWADVNSLAEQLDPQDNTKTLEGYEAPWRSAFLVKK